MSWREQKEKEKANATKKYTRPEGKGEHRERWITGTDCRSNVSVTVS